MPATKSKYEFRIVNPSGGLVALFTDELYNRSYYLRRNRAEEISFSIDLDRLEQYARANKFSNALDVFNVNVNEIQVWRYGVPIVGGQIQSAIPEVDEDNRSVAVRAIGFLDLFEDRYLRTALSYSNTNLGAIAWNYINHTQTQTNGDWGITQGSNAVSALTNRERNPKIDKNIKELLIELTEVQNPIDFEFTYNKVFNVYSEIGATTDILLTYPGNIIGLSAPLDGSNQVNEVVARGDAAGDGEALRTTYSKTDTQATYKRREKIIDFSSVSKIDTLNEHAQEYAEQNDTLFDLPRVRLDGNRGVSIGDIHIGDKIKLAISGYTAFNHLNDDFYRIDEIDVTIEDDDKEDIELGLSGV